MTIFEAAEELYGEAVRHEHPLSHPARIDCLLLIHPATFAAICDELSPLEIVRDRHERTFMRGIPVHCDPAVAPGVVRLLVPGGELAVES